MGLLGNPEKVPNVLVLDALGRIERSELFRTAKNLSKILRICVEGTLADKPPTAAKIAKEILTEYAFKHDPKGGGVRVQAKTLREKLDEYQKKDGAQELVWIDLPDGAYEAKFSYNPNSEIMKHVAVADAFKAGLMFGGDWGGAYDEIIQVINAEPDFMPGYAMAVECGMLSAWLDMLTVGEQTQKIPTESFEPAAHKVLHRITEDCQSALVAGGMACILCKWQFAKEAFSKARELDAVKAQGSLWYALFLILTGEFKEGLEISKMNVEVYPSRDSVKLCQKLFLYLTRDFSEASKQDQMELTGTEMGIRADAALRAYACMAENKFVDASIAFEALRRRAGAVDERQVTQIGALLFCFRRAVEIWEESGDTDWGKVKGWKDKGDYYERIYREHIDRIEPLQRMFFHMANGDGKRAITALRSECLRSRHPFAAALWYWPFLDDLRDHPRFTHLARRLNVPEAQRIASEKLINSKGGRSI